MTKKRKGIPVAAARPESAAPGDLVFLLERLNFTEVEARAYLALFSQNPATAYQIAQLTGLPRPNVYNAVGGLVARGALQQVSESPVRYIPSDPAEFFSTISRSTTEICDDVVTGLRDMTVGDGTEYVATYTGRDAVDTQIRKMISAAQAHIYLKSSSRLLAPFHEALVESAERGIRIYMVVADPGISELPSHENIVVIPHEGTGVATGVAVHYLLTLSADSDGMLIAALNGEPSASYTRNGAIVYTIHTMILHEIYLAEIHRAMGPELELRFGKNLEKLRRTFRPENLENRVLARSAPREPGRPD